MNILDKGYITFKNLIWREREAFQSDERGVSGIVATVILVLLAVALAVIFWDKIKEFVETTLWNKVTNQEKKLPEG